MKKYFFVFIILISTLLYAEKPPASKATGIFLAAGVGPRLPVGSFATSTDLGYGLNLEISYTDSDNLPFFVFAKIGYEQYPGAQSFYQSSEYSNYSTQILPVNLGIRYYLSPLVSSAVLLMPVFEIAASYSYIKNLHEFKVDSGRNNFTEEVSKFGGSAGVGISMFLLEIIASYNYFESNQYVSINLNVRLPLIINL
jgi:hypothetical protein